MQKSSDSMETKDKTDSGCTPDTHELERSTSKMNSIVFSRHTTKRINESVKVPVNEVLFEKVKECLRKISNSY